VIHTVNTAKAVRTKPAAIEGRPRISNHLYRRPE